MLPQFAERASIRFYALQGVTVPRKRLQDPTGGTGKVKPEKPAVIVDFLFDKGFLYISIQNISDEPAFQVRVEFNQKIMGIEGTKEISSLPLFQKLEFLAPKKQIVTFLDTSASYFARGGPTGISAKVSFQDWRGTRKTITIHHDLEIYREIGYVSGVSHPVGVR